MNCTKQTYYGNKSFFRSWLESSPAHAEPKPFSTFRRTRPSDRTYSQLHQLKRKLLRAALEETPETGTFKQLCGAANQAADLAWATSHPLLVFPHLFDEMVTAVLVFKQEIMHLPELALDAGRFGCFGRVLRMRMRINQWKVAKGQA